MTLKRKIVIAGTSFSALAIALLAGMAYLDQSFSTAILWKGRQACGYKMPCVFSLGEVFPGDWDHVVVFDMAATQDEIESTVGKGLNRPDLKRLIVFMKGSKALRYIAERQGVEHPEHGEVTFDRVPITANHISIDRNANFVFVKGAPSCEDCMSLEQLRPGEVVE